MKKLVSVLLVLMMLLAGSAAFAESSFSFRGGLHWGMTLEELIAVEGVQPASTEEYTYHITKAVFENMTVSSYNCTITYWFVDGGLAQSEILLNRGWNYFDFKKPQIVTDLGNALAYAYGEAADMNAEADPKLLTAYEAIMDGKPTSGIIYANSINYDKLYCYWLPAADSAIAIVGHDEAMFLHYVNVDIDWVNALNEAAPVITPVPNTFGL